MSTRTCPPPKPTTRRLGTGNSRLRVGADRQACSTASAHTVVGRRNHETGWALKSPARRTGPPGTNSSLDGGWPARPGLWPPAPSKRRISAQLSTSSTSYLPGRSSGQGPFIDTPCGGPKSRRVRIRPAIRDSIQPLSTPADAVSCRSRGEGRFLARWGLRKGQLHLAPARQRQDPVRCCRCCQRC